MAFSREIKDFSGKTVEVLYPLHEIDSYNGEEMKTFIIEHDSYDAVIVNFSRVNYLNSSGLRELIQILKFLKERGKLLFLTNLSEEINKIFDSTNLHRLFSIHPTDETAGTILEG
ncbi:MAG: STAS domain-containing protein [Geovibrio sp.]|jgi:anti-sigma B factor antagonist|uniref:STAS domain-containing protein n=1 Tax=Geovibrio ferrireducens TaxID=46201 RepID=UPI002246134A|nr:STAS domain-containing protein [Geovibrio ferrireducens]MCD8492392.1 STAS domain-containing protein [Geovibrio sp.]MCD8569903.1 STAS domain-containing protein [Geovibrio sp.]